MAAATAMDEQFVVRDTSLGPIGLAWTDRGLSRLQLPECDRATTAARMAQRGATAAAGELPDAIAALLAALDGYAGGRPTAFDDVPLDLGRGRPFDLPVWEAARRLAWGEVVTYGELTRRLGPPYVATAVGQALGRNPVPIVVPCHRIVAANHRLGGFSAPGGAVTKQRLLTLEGVTVAAPAPLLDLMTAPDA